ncbi:MAG: zinc ribbon domain-containing protein [Chloroflexota bacterium]|nr:zinc ribbon domain-containing protein [Chloroflexota bacterium]
MGRNVENLLAQEFTCPRCKHVGAHVERLAMSGTGLSRLLEIQAHRYAFVSCTNCGYTEVYNLRTLEGKDNLGTLLEVIFSD